jgi:ribose transport system ATP-binding protein
MTDRTNTDGAVAATGHGPVGRPIVDLRNVSKVYGATRALNNVSLTLQAGSVHGLVGQNGCGKSTLIKVLAGAIIPDTGEIELADGQTLHALSPELAASSRFAFVHRDLALVDSVSVMENVLVGSLITGFAWRVKWREQRRVVTELLARLESNIDPDATVATLTSAQRAIVAIARATYVRGTGKPALLVLDEPTAYLPLKERGLLFTAVRKIAADGGAVLFVSHRTDEVLEICDSVTVLRNGQVVQDGPVTGQDEDTLVASIVGRSLGEIYPSRSSATETGQLPTPALTVEHLSAARLHDISFDVKAGEIIGVTGLLGMGQDDLPYAVTGVLRVDSGSLSVDGKPVSPLNPRNAILAGLGLLPSDRPRDSGILTATLRENLTLVDVGRFTKIGRLQHAAERAISRQLLVDFDVQPPGGTERALGSLSGGNQQKVLIAKWLSDKRLRCLILHEPAQGVDVGAKQTLLKIVAAAADAGLAIVIVSVEYGDLAAMCDRVLVLRDGTLSSELSGSGLTDEHIMQACYGRQPRAAHSPIVE